MNHPVSTFRALSSAFQYDAASDAVEELAADFAAQVAREPYSLCVGLVRRDAVRKLYGLVYLLDGYGLTLRQRQREGGEGVFVYAERKLEPVSEFIDAVVSEHRVSTDLVPVYAQAA